MSVGAVVAGAGSSAGLIGMFLGIYPPLLDYYTQESNEYKPTKLPDLGTTVEMRFREEITHDEYIRIFARTGIKPEYANKIYNMSEQLLTANEYVLLWRRGRMTEEVLTDHLKKLHLSTVDGERLKAVTEFFPSPGDLITFAVREVYNPEIVDKFGQLEDLPPKFMEEAKKVGVPDEHARNYWASHWILPSILQGFEMLHRRVIDQDTLDLLLKSLDIMPFWRDALTAISYNPLTRVDVRRMYGIGTLNEDEVFESYLDGGYSPINAERMTEFTKLYESDETTGLTRASVMKAYKINLITRDEMKAFFVSFGYTDQVIDFWLDTADYEKTLAEIEATKDELVDRYRMGAMDMEELNVSLSSLDLPSFYITKVIDDEKTKQSVKLKLPSRSDLENWLKLNLIADVDFVDYMRQLGYRDGDIQLYLSEITLEIDTSVRKYLGIKTYIRWLSTAIINRETFINITTEMGYNTEDQDRMIMEIEVQKLESD